MADPTYRMFIDDSGNVDEKASNDPQLRFGSVTGVIFQRAYLESTFNPGFSKLVQSHFGLVADGRPPTIHRRILVAPPADGPFAKLHDPDAKRAWNADVVRLFRESEYSVITICVDKIAFYYNNPEWRGDFYQILITYALERFFFFLRNRGIGDITIEAKNPERDQRIKTHYRDAMTNGFRYIQAHRLQAAFTSNEINIQSKKAGLQALQFADLAAHPAYAKCYQIYADMFVRPRGIHGEIGQIIENEKFYRDQSGNPNGYGRKWIS